MPCTHTNGEFRAPHEKHVTVEERQGWRLKDGYGVDPDHDRKKSCK